MSPMRLLAFTVAAFVATAAKVLPSRPRLGAPLLHRHEALLRGNAFTFMQQPGVTTTGPPGTTVAGATGAPGTTGAPGIAGAPGASTTPGPGLLGAPGPAPEEPAPAPAPVPAPEPPPPPCDWYRDSDGIARPLECHLLPDGKSACRPSKNISFSAHAEEYNCEAPYLVNCHLPPTGNLGMWRPYYEVHGNLTLSEHGTKFDVTCAEEAAPTDGAYPLDTWGEDWYAGRTEASTTCDNGTWTNITFINQAVYQPDALSCHTLEQIRLLKDMHHYRQWVQKYLDETELIPYKWKDATAKERMDKVKHALVWAQKFYVRSIDEDNIPPADQLQDVINWLIENSMISRGEPQSQETCKDLEQHFLWQLEKPKNGWKNYIPPKNETMGHPNHEDVKLEKPVSFTCSYTVQKTGIGFDVITRTDNFFYRDGCFCESRWMQGCPFQIDYTPSFNYFGFDSLDMKDISSAMGSYSPNALCWYWSTPTHPEWGYLGRMHSKDFGQAYQAPLKNSSELLKAKIAKMEAKAP